MTAETQTAIETWPGRGYPLGASFDGGGTNFAVFSEVAERVELALFDEHGSEHRVALDEVDAFSWHAYVPNVGSGQRYGYRVYGPYAPEHGVRCNPNKLLLDPYARAIEGEIRWDQACYSYNFGDELSRNDADSAPFVPRSIVHDSQFDWGDDHAPDIPLHETVIYEAHVKGFTRCRSEIPEEFRGTYAGFAHPASIEHLRSLGVTAVELMPVHQFVQDQRLLEQGLRNYWGYNTIGFFAPHNEYSSRGGHGEQVNEFKAMVRALHQAGIEVILDVVYNHTAEGNHLGPTLCFKGLDNRAYYRLVQKSRQYYYDTTGTGNSLNVQHGHTLQLIMDSLRYWVTEMHVDGFRFDLAATLAREFHEVDRLSTFFDLIQQDPVVNRVKLIAEPWDIGEGGYQVGNFPALWSEWNGRFRDAVRDFWRGEPSTVGELASRLTGSSDLYQSDMRRPVASVNFITAHDGFTLRDLVSYNGKHNEANSEGNADGESHNRSWNCGVEGDTDDRSVLKLRAQQQRNLLTTLLLAQGVPMLVMGDELGRTQRGNNNGYCQDNELSWVNWAEVDGSLLDFVRWLIDFRRRHPSFRRRRWFQGRPIRGAVDVVWLRPDGKPMSNHDWRSRHARALGVYMNGAAIPGHDERGRPIADESFLLLFNGQSRAVYWSVPRDQDGEWRVVLDTDRLQPLSEPEAVGDRVLTRARSVSVLCR